MKIKRLLLIFFIVITVPFGLQAQLNEIRSLQLQIPAIKDSTGYVDALNRLSMLSHLKSADSCFYYAEKAMAIGNRLQYKQGQADALNNMAIVYAIKTNTYLAAKYFNDALGLYRELKDSSNECQVIMNQGVILTIENKRKEGLEYFRQAYKLGEKLSKDSIQELVILNMIQVDSTLSADSVRGLLSHARSIARRYNDERAMLVCFETEATQLLKSGRKNDAVNLLKNSVHYADSIGCEYERMNIYITLGDILIGDSTKEALQYYNNALNTSSLNGYTDFITASAEKLYDYYTSAKDTSHANKYAAVLLKEYRDYQNYVQQSGFSYLDYALQQKELATVKNNSTVKKTVIIILSVLSATIIALLFFMMRAQQSRKKYVELLKQRNEQAGSRNAELQYKNEFNNRLISLLAHDFRQPLAAVKGMMALLKEPGALSKAEMDFLVSKIETSSDTSLEIFDNILHWIKKQVSGFVYEPTAMQLKELVDEAGRTLQYVTDKFSIVIVNNITDATTIMADKEMLQFVNRNLIHNAIKFSPSNATVSISAYKSAGEIVVAVKDQGKGMTKEKLDSLFNIFSKTQYASDKEKGSGVALVICKDFLERMNGRIWAESEPGKGTTFLYALPLGD